MTGPPGDPAGRTRVAILGGGPSALAAAFELTSTPELQAAHEVTIYQPGWRLGGKCASGRNRGTAERIEEHGLHVWFGCYDNAFSLMRRCYAELARDPQTDALATWDRAFKPCDQVVLWSLGNTWTPHVVDFPRNGLAPGAERRRTFLEVCGEVLGWIHRSERELAAADDAIAIELDRLAAPGGAGLRAACEDVGLEVQRDEHLGVALLFDCVTRLAERHLDRATRGLGGAEEDRRGAVGFLTEYRERSRALDAAFPGHPGVRFLAGTVDMAMAAISGILLDGLLLRGFDAINDEELSDWLARHGAAIDREHPERNSPFLRGVYDGSFAFVDGDPLQPNMAAGRALQGAIRCLFHYSGSVLWRMQAGMGDAVIAPLYEVLRRRGVRFAFFHAARELRPSADGRRVGEIEIVRQVATAKDDYAPLVEVAHAGRRLPCWPDAPLFGQLAGGRTKAVRAADFEHEIAPLGRRSPSSVLRAGADFDVAILAVPPDVQRQICAPLVQADAGYAAMLAGTSTVVTQAVQLWLDRTPAELGWRWSSDSLMSMYVEPLDTYCDMSHLLASECWPEGSDVRHAAYLCGVIPHGEVADAEQAQRSVRRHARAFLERDAGRFWPAVATRLDGTGFRWSRLVAPAELRGPARLDAQYLRVNHQPTERYVLTLAGSVASRRWPSERSFENLVFAGDWTRNGFDAGCVEGAMTSGMLAARAISSQLAGRPLAGLDGPAGFPNAPGGRAGGAGGPVHLLAEGLERAAGLVAASAGRVWALATGRR